MTPERLDTFFPFSTPLLLNADDGLPVSLMAPLVYYSKRLGRTIIVPAGFVSDLASVPRVLWNLLPPLANYTRAAVVHDFLYVTNGLTRGEADAVLLEAMEATGVSGTSRRAIYAGVRLGGWKPWGRYRRLAQALAEVVS
jgi:uncharacterized protein DUF1353